VKIKKHVNFKEAFKSIIQKDKKYTIIRHILSSSDKIPLHSHDVDEFVVIGNCKFRAILEDEEKIFDLKDAVVSISFPKGQKHTIIPLSNVSYFVIRDVP
jgi:hypothetical protein